MIYFTGDTHGDIGRYNTLMETHPYLKENDYLIICGDFGFLFENNKREQLQLDKLSNAPYTICFIDGNHENFYALNSFPIEYWNGGKVHKLRHNIIHLMRGQVFDICEKKLFTMGGAYSIDRYTRRLNESYWAEELPNNSEYKEATSNLERVGFKVDYIVTHTAPRKQIHRMGYTPDPHDAELTGFLEWVMYETIFSSWYYGHWHLDEDFDNIHALWFRVMEAASDIV